MQMFPAKTGHALLRDLQNMVTTDETAGAMMWCVRTVLTTMPWKHKPQVLGQDMPADPQAIKAAEFADSLMQDMTVSWGEHVEECVTMLWAGFAPCEIITKQRTGGTDSLFDDSYWGVKHLPLRDPLSITRVNYQDNDRNQPVSFTQMNYSGGATLPLWKVANYRMDAHLDSPWGTPLFRSALKPWHFKNRCQESEAVGIERDLCGIPVFRVPMEDMEKAGETGSDGQPTDEAKVAMARIGNAQKAVRDMRFNKSAGLVLPSDTWGEDNPGDRTPLYDFKLVTSAGQRSIDVRTAIRDYDRAIARVLLMQFLHLGDRSSGSYALSDDQSTLAVNALKAIARKIADVWRKSVLQLIWAVNLMDMKYLPRLDAGEVSKEGLTSIGTFLRGIGSILPLIQEDPRAREAVLTAAGIDSDRQSQADTAARTSKAAETAVTVAANPPPTQTAPPPTDPSANDNRGSG